MQPSYLKFESATAAQRAKRILQNHGIASAVRRDPNPDRRFGCTFALVVRGGLQQAERVLQNHGVTPLARSDGRDAP